jgi:adenylate cyclase class IV
MSTHTNGAHLETEKGYRISKSEYHLLRHLLPKIGFAFQKKSIITDFVVPTRGATTRRLRVERIKKSADGKTGLNCIRTFKSHPIKGEEGRHVRKEQEKKVSPSQALAFIIGEIEELGAAIPYYTKKRWHFQGMYKGYQMTIALDHAVGLGRFSGRYMEIETILPVDASRKQVKRALKAIEKLSFHLVAEYRPSKISYRKMLMATWTHTDHSKKKLRKAKVNYVKLVSRIARRRPRRPSPKVARRIPARSRRPRVAA